MSIDKPRCPFHTDSDPFASGPQTRFDNWSEMRSQCPVNRLQDESLFISGYNAALAGLKNHRHFHGTFGDTGGLHEDDRIFASLPEPRHSEFRRILNTALIDASTIEPLSRELASSLMKEVLQKATADGEVEIMSLYGGKIPSIIIAHLLGLPTEDFEKFTVWTDEMVLGQGAIYNTDTPITEGHKELSRYLAEQIEQRANSENPPDDVITRLLTTPVEGKCLTQRAVLTQLVFFIVAGNETTRNLMGNMFYRLAKEPDLFASIRNDRSLIANFIEEVLRLDSPVQMIFRSCVEDIELDDVTVKEQERIIFGLAAGNRDEAIFPEPTQLILDRPKPRMHLAFGKGGHVCPGAYLARLEAQVALETLFDSVSSLSLAPDYQLDIKPICWAYGPQTVRVTLTQAK